MLAVGEVRGVCGTAQKRCISGRYVPTRCETGPSRPRWRHGPKPTKTLQREVVRPLQELESENQNRNPGLSSVDVLGSPTHDAAIWVWNQLSPVAEGFLVNGPHGVGIM